MKIRLNRFLSQCGISSRRKADELITSKKVSVNGSVVEELGTTIDPEKDVVRVDNKVLKAEKKRYIALNKPRLYLTTLVNNEDDKPTIVELIKGVKERVFPVGRLDFDSEGLLLLTNDGELANRVHHPKYGITKTYNAIVRETPDEKTIKKIVAGIRLDGSFVKPDAVKFKKLKNGNYIITISFHEGKKHLVKNYLNYFDLPVERLRRTHIGNLKLGRLPEGSWRDLSEEELKHLRKKTALV